MNWVYDEKKRIRFGSAGIVFGIFTAFIGLAIAIYFGNEEFFSDVSLGNVPRWVPVTFGQITAVAGSQFIIIGAFLVWVTGREMTWARAGFAAFITWFQLIMYYGIIPSEWLNLTQGPLGWTSQKVFITIPSWLVLNNDVEISFAVVKDLVSGGYHGAVLTLGILLAYKIQGFGKGAPKPVAEVASPYGRPLSKGSK